MTGPEHYRKAEQLLAAAERRLANDDLLHVPQQRLEMQGKALVHATLALAAATALTTHAGVKDWEEWCETAGEKP